MLPRVNTPAGKAISGASKLCLCVLSLPHECSSSLSLAPLTPTILGLHQLKSFTQQSGFNDTDFSQLLTEVQNGGGSRRRAHWKLLFLVHRLFLLHLHVVDREIISVPSLP